jgi:hypothetical protein
MDAALPLYRLYEENAGGGALHFIVDDLNVDDACLAAVDGPLTDSERNCLNALLPLSEDQRIAAIWYYEKGDWLE